MEASVPYGPDPVLQPFGLKVTHREAYLNYRLTLSPGAWVQAPHWALPPGEKSSLCTWHAYFFPTNSHF